MGMRAAHSLTSQDRLENVREIMTLACFFTCDSDFSPAVTVDLLTADVVNIAETEHTLTIQLEVTGYSYGVIPLQILPLTYNQFEEMRDRFGVRLSLGEIAGSVNIPDETALPCKLRILVFPC